MDQVLEHVEGGHSELLQFYSSNSNKGGKWLVIKIFAVLLLFLIFFMIFVA
jgi:syntaxin 5